MRISWIVVWVLASSVACGGGSGAADGQDGGTGTEGGGDGGGSGDGAADDDTGDAGTSGGDDEDDGPRSGSRLELRFHGEQIAGIWDSELETMCTFRFAADGLLRCLPDRAASGQAWLGADLWVPYVAGNESCAPGFVVVDAGESAFSCTPNGWTVRALGDAALEVCTGVTNGACSITQGIGDSAPPGASFWLAGDQIEPSAFVAGEIAVVESDARLVQRWLDGEDGSRVPWDLYDLERETPCAFRQAEDGVLRCLAIAPADGWSLVPPREGSRPYRRGNVECPPDAIEWRHTPSAYSCDEATTAVHELGAAVSEVCLATTNGACTTTQQPSDDAPNGATFWLAGDAVDSAQFVAGTRARTENGERIESWTITTDDGVEAYAGAFDTMLGIDCAFTRSSDGETRCLPITTTDDGHLDPATTDLVPVRRGNAGCPPAFLVRTASASAFACEPPATEVYEIGDTSTSICTSVSEGACISWLEPGADAPSGATFFHVGAIVAPDTFAAAP